MRRQLLHGQLIGGLPGRGQRLAGREPVVTCLQRRLDPRVEPNLPSPTAHRGSRLPECPTRTVRSPGRIRPAARAATGDAEPHDLGVELGGGRVAAQHRGSHASRRPRRPAPRPPRADPDPGPGHRPAPPACRSATPRADAVPVHRTALCPHWSVAPPLAVSTTIATARTGPLNRVWISAVRAISSPAVTQTAALGVVGTPSTVMAQPEARTRCACPARRSSDRTCQPASTSPVTGEACTAIIAVAVGTTICPLATASWTTSPSPRIASTRACPEMPSTGPLLAVVDRRVGQGQQHDLPGGEVPAEAAGGDAIGPGRRRDDRPGCPGAVTTVAPWTTACCGAKCNAVGS